MGQLKVPCREAEELMPTGTAPKQLQMVVNALRACGIPVAAGVDAYEIARRVRLYGGLQVVAKEARQLLCVIRNFQIQGDFTRVLHIADVSMHFTCIAHCFKVFPFQCLSLTFKQAMFLTLYGVNWQYLPTLIIASGSKVLAGSHVSRTVLACALHLHHVNYCCLHANTKFVNFANDVTFEFSSTSGGCSGDGNADSWTEVKNLRYNFRRTSDALPTPYVYWHHYSIFIPFEIPFIFTLHVSHITPIHCPSARSHHYLLNSLSVSWINSMKRLKSSCMDTVAFMPALRNCLSVINWWIGWEKLWKVSCVLLLTCHYSVVGCCPSWFCNFATIVTCWHTWHTYFNMSNPLWRL